MKAKVGNPTRRRLAILALSLVLSCGLVVAVDRCVGALQAVHVLDFAPNGEVTYATSEFSCVARFNSLGMRGGELAPRPERTRLVAVGDSNTFGWGVAGDEAWPSVLEKTLRARGLDVEVANAGRPGIGPAEYAAVTRRAVPLLAPSLVIVGVLQQDDLDSLDTEHRPARPETSRAGASRLLRALLPNLMRALRDKPPEKQVSAETIRAGWRAEAAMIEAENTPEQRANFERLDATVKEAYRTGDLNPHIVRVGIRTPDAFERAATPDDPRWEAPVGRLAVLLGEMAASAREGNASLLVVSLPAAPYTNACGLAGAARDGFSVRPELLKANGADALIERACKKAGVPFLSILDDVRRRLPADQGFFPRDLHPTAAAHRAFAEAMAAEVERRVRGGT